MNVFSIILIICLMTTLTSGLNAQNVSPDTLRKAYIPTNVRLQYAGNIGMFSLGPTWSFLKNRIDVELSIGYVPKLYAMQPIYIAALKGIYTPKLDINYKKIIIKPLSVGMALSYTFGNRFNKYNDGKQYPNGYYWWNPHYRFGFLYRAEIYTPINNKRIKGLSLYFEASLWDLGLYNYTGNGNSSVLSLWDVTTLGFGTKIFFQ